MNLHDSPYNNGLLFVNFNQDFGEFFNKLRRKLKIILCCFSLYISANVR